ncbi:DUF3370 domain-containing protein [Chlorogloeopsis fritschii PCC 9212]|uniref:DUF3370 domain-containing protein n=1 Tax=Chlorogloeopsis fritschii PCC 6912 TaxID=211165 RepID=A0A433N2V7_CHLFR|nr:DUF3370 domain-containing protein [Chlorogloeopsis fritschii]RUR75507.1 hypothetical protein PCC6912_47380 [Chlorogloeopsis fritschii PCC 6912]
MLPFLLILPIFPILPIAQTTPLPPQEEIVQTQQVRPLPGKLNRVPTFNSNSPEKVLKEGILLSTFPPQGKKVPAAHLNFPFQGRFDIFAHHVAEAPTPDNLRSLYLGIMLHNPGKQPVRVSVLQGASYLSQPDAPFIELPSFTLNPSGTVFAGPGDRVMSDVLRGRRQDIFPAQIVIPPGQSQMVLNAPIPVKGLTPPLNGRSTLIRLQSNGTVYAASLAMFAPTNTDGSERAPTLEEWKNLLNNGDLSSPRDKTPTPLEKTDKPIIYGRVAGVAQGTHWRANITDSPKVKYLTIPQPGQAYSYALSTLHRGTLGTNQIQSAPMLARYPDTAYRAHGNYGIQYSLKLPLYNNTKTPQTVSISMQTPIKEDQLVKPGLRFFNTPAQQVFFRGTVQVRYKDDGGKPQTQFVHLVQRRGQPGEPLVKLNMKPGDQRLVQVDFLYPPDATPPQVLTVQTLNRANLPSGIQQ